MVWGAKAGRGLTKLHMLPTSQTLTSEYYINQILEKEVKPLTSRRLVTGGPIERKLFSSKRDDIRLGWSTGLHACTLQRQLRHGVKRICQTL